MQIDKPRRHAGAPGEAAPWTDETARVLVGDWVFDPAAGRLSRGEVVVALEPKQRAVLALLCRRPGEVVDADGLLDAVWRGEALGDNPVHKVIAALRRALGDSATQPRYVETLRQRGYRLIAPVRRLSGDGVRSLASGWRGQSPFCGLAPFGPSHASVFFGRDPAVATLRERLAAQWARGRPLVLLLGPSGCGKTSLVQAGLIPALGVPDPASALPPVCCVAVADLGTTDESGIWATFAGTLLDWESGGAPLLSGHSIESLATALREDRGAVWRQLAIGLRTPPGAAPGAPPFLVLDRLEAVFQQADGALARAFVDCVDSLVQSRLALVLAVCRNDFYSELAAHEPLMRDKQHGAHMDLAPPGRDAIAQIIRLPARAAALVYGTDASGMNRLDDRLCADAMQTGDALPLLQYTLQELYLQRGPGGELSWEAYGAIGGLEGAIGRRAEATLSALPAARQEALDRVLPRLVGLTRDDPVPTGRWVAEASLDDDDERALVQALVEARLLVADHLRGKPGYRVAHEALLRRWPRVTAWVGRHRATLAVRDELLPWVQRWLDAARPNALLLPGGTLLWQSRAAVAAAPDLFGGDERAFVGRSSARLRRQARLRWMAGAGAVLLAIVAALGAWRSAQLARTASAHALQSQRLASFMLGELADQLRPIGRLDLLSRIGEQAWQVLSPASSHDESPADLLQRAKALVVIGETNSSRGQGRTAVAVKALEDAAQMLRAIEHAPGLAPGDYYATLGASAFWRGQIAFDAGDGERAALEMQRYREACERWLAAAPADAKARTELGFALNSLGSIAVQRAAWADAQHWFEASLALKQALLAAQPEDAQAQDAVASSRVWLGLVAHVRGESARALALLDAAAATQRRLLAQRPAELDRVADLGATMMRRAEVLRDLGRLDEAAAAMDDAAARLESAARGDPQNRHWAAERAHAQAARRLAHLDAGDTAANGPPAARAAADVPAPQESTPPSIAAELVAVLEHAIAGERARRAGDWTAALAAATDGGRLVAALLAQRPLQWQLIELQARLGSLQLRALAETGPAGERAAACRRIAAALEPAVHRGQGGPVIDAWQSARSCAVAGEPDTAPPGRQAAPRESSPAPMALNDPKNRWNR